jgi:four helix bundle protein
MPISNYRNLRVWQSAMDLVILIYRIADQVLAPNRQPIAEALRSAAALVPVKIATGNSRFSDEEYLACIAIAHSALIELSILLEVAVRLGCVRPSDTTEAEVLADHTLRMLTTLATRLERGTPQTSLSSRRRRNASNHSALPGSGGPRAIP